MVTIVTIPGMAKHKCWQGKDGAMSYADYDYYKDTYLGTAVAEAEFPFLAERASEYIDYMTRGRATADMEAAKKATCALAETYQLIEKAKAASMSAGGEIQSQTVGSYSVTYKSASDTSNSYEATLYSTARRYLANTGLLYRGGCCGCTRLM